VTTIDQDRIKDVARRVTSVSGHTTHFEPHGVTRPAPSAIPKTRWAKTVDGVWIAYQDFGTGPLTLVFMNGLYSHLEVYWELPQYARFMNRLAAGVRVLHFDRRGTGLSDRISYTPTLESRMDDIRAVMDAAEVERAALYGWGWGAPALAALFAGTYPDRTVALLLDGWLALRWAPDYSFGLPPEELDDWLSRLLAIWGDEDHALEIAQLTCGNRPEDGPWDDPEFVRWHAKLARNAATPGSFEAFEREEYETDVREAARQVHVPTAILKKKGAFPEEIEVARYNAALIPGARLIWLDGAADIPMFDEIEAYTDAMIAFLRSVEDEEHALDRVLATVLFTDVVGSTQKAAEMGDARWKDLLERQNVTVRAMLARYRGTEVKTMGDGFLATFDGPARAVKCAQAICEAVKPLGIEVRAGCHTGEIELLGKDVGGIAVHVAARVSALAGPSEVLVSSTVRDLVAGSGLVFEDHGEHSLKGLPEKRRLYGVTSAVSARDICSNGDAPS
jgi:class 3 adenylate cyclase